MSARTGSLRIRSYCICGSKLDASSSPPDAAEAVHEMWRGLHTGTGHGGCDARTASRARAKQRNRHEDSAAASEPKAAAVLRPPTPEGDAGGR